MSQKDIYDKLKAAGDIFKQYWAIIVMILAALGNVYQYNNRPVASAEPTCPTQEAKTVIIDATKCMGKLDKQIDKFDSHVDAFKESQKTYHP